MMQPNGSMYAKRNGEYWRDLTGDKMVYLLAAKVQEAQNLISEAGPLAWVVGEKESEAYEWEKKAYDFLHT